MQGNRLTRSKGNWSENKYNVWNSEELYAVAESESIFEVRKRISFMMFTLFMKYWAGRG